LSAWDSLEGYYVHSMLWASLFGFPTAKVVSDFAPDCMWVATLATLAGALVGLAHANLARRGKS